jgi:hypothetical protein
MCHKGLRQLLVAIVLSSTTITAATRATNPLEHIKYMAWYHDSPSETAGFSNLNLRVETASEVVALMKQTGYPSLLDAYMPLWKRNGTNDHLYLRPDYKAAVAKFAAAAKPLLANRSIIGFNLGDELSWSCVTPTDLAAGAAEIRSHFPRGSAVIWYNEASGPLDPTSRWRVPRPWGKAICPEIHANYSIPAALDWFSVDIYDRKNSRNFVTSQVKDFYEANIYPHLSAEQRTVLVPGSFGCNSTMPTCDTTAYDSQCTRDAHDFIAWATADTRVVGVFPWHWAPCPNCQVGDRGGTRDLPATRFVWEEFGRKIKGGRAVINVSY